MTEEEMAALAVVLDLITPATSTEMEPPPVSRWKLAGRMPELGMEDLRALH